MPNTDSVIKELKERKEKADKAEEKLKYSVVCNHLKYPSLFGLTRVKSYHVNKTPPPKMTGYVFVCKVCEPYLEHMTPNVARKGFSRMYEYEVEKNLSKIEK